MELERLDQRRPVLYSKWRSCLSSEQDEGASTQSNQCRKSQHDDCFAAIRKAGGWRRRLPQHPAQLQVAVDLGHDPFGILPVDLTPAEIADDEPAVFRGDPRGGDAGIWCCHCHVRLLYQSDRDRDRDRNRDPDRDPDPDHDPDRDPDRDHDHDNDPGRDPLRIAAFISVPWGVSFSTRNNR